MNTSTPAIIFVIPLRKSKLNNLSSFSIVKYVTTPITPLTSIIIENNNTKVSIDLIGLNIKNKDKKTIELEYETLVSGCKLAIVLISMQGRYLMYSVIAEQAGYINPDVHIRNQMLLFGGIVKEAKIANYNFASEEIIDNYFSEIFKEVYSHLPIGEALGIIKEKSNPIIEKIETSISLNLKEDFLDDF